ncbi:uncharacterized protein LOC100824865 [Brachypodium distachyon]|nr:uncharacterized protein LOC100824865 [Brachypodium distachyon]|eukprot:XP_003579827.1 uncharacterized protein LOC100824865 [Brachypodium distachyon]
MAKRVPFSLLLVLLVGGFHAATASVEETCASATAKHKDLESFCVTTLQAAPGSATADAHGLAVIATNLTLANYTEAVATIKDLQRRGGWPEPAQAALATCRQRYLEAQNVVHSAIHALATGQKQAYVADMGVVRKAPVDCQGAFGKIGGGAAAAAEKEGSLLLKVNDDAQALTTLDVLIVLSL